MISGGFGAGHEDDFERACLCIERMHRIVATRSSNTASGRDAIKID